MILTGEASYHAPYDYCTANYLKQAGVDAKWLILAEYGVHGNGHLIFVEKNNMEIAELVNEWIGHVVETGRSVLRSGLASDGHNNKYAEL